MNKLKEILKNKEEMLAYDRIMYEFTKYPGLREYFLNTKNQDVILDIDSLIKPYRIELTNAYIDFKKAEKLLKLNNIIK